METQAPVLMKDLRRQYYAGRAGHGRGLIAECPSTFTFWCRSGSAVCQSSPAQFQPILYSWRGTSHITDRGKVAGQNVVNAAGPFQTSREATTVGRLNAGGYSWQRLILSNVKEAPREYRRVLVINASTT